MHDIYVICSCVLMSGHQNFGQLSGAPNVCDQFVEDILLTLDEDPCKLSIFLFLTNPNLYQLP